MLLTGSQIVIEVLLENQADTVFGYPGGHILCVYDELQKNSDKIKHILTAHEQGASHAADGYARTSGKVGVCIATSGPGTTNIITGLATAMMDSVPVVAITGSVPLKFSGTDFFQEVDAIGLTAAVTKHSFFVRKAEDIADTLRSAFEIAKEGRPGPVLVDIPHNVQMELAVFKKEENKKTETIIEKAETECLDKCLKLIEEAQRPIIYCGGGIINGGCEKELTALAEKIDAFVSCTMMGLSAIKGEHPLNLGMSGVYGRRAASMAIAKSDLIIAAGVRFADRGTGNKDKFGCDAKIIHLDIDSAEHGKIIKADVQVMGELKSSLSYLCENAKAKSNIHWHNQVEEIKKDYGEQAHDESEFCPKEIIETVSKLADDDTIIATDVGQHQMWVAKHYSFKKPRTFLTSGGFGTMGYGMGAAIGGAVAAGKRAVLFTGDGSFHMNMSELSTAVRHNIPITVIVLDNGRLGMIEQLQTYFYNNNIFSTELGHRTDFSMVAKAMSAKGETVRNMDELKKAVEKSFKEKGPVVINCIISEDNRAVPMMRVNGSVHDMIVT